VAKEQESSQLEIGDRLPFGELALLEGLISREELCKGLRDQVLRDQRIGKILVQNGALTKQQARQILRLQKREGPIDGYALQQRIGSGGMGTVYRALQKSLGRTVAIKVLAPHAAAHESHRKRFIQEARLLAQLQHPNLVQCFDIGESNQHVFIVMEFVQGRNTRELLLHNGPFDEEEGLRIMVEILRAMVHYDLKDIIHRDIKPENIMVAENGRAKLADLGLSKQLTNDLYITKVGKTLGTPYYISPELAKGQSDIDIRSDLYSLGATFYHLFAGSPLFTGDSSAEILTKHVREAPERPSKRNDKLSKSLDRFMLRLLEKKRDRRYQTPEEVIDDAERILAGTGVDASPLRRRSTSATSGVKSVSAVSKRDRSAASARHNAKRRRKKSSPLTQKKALGAAALLLLGLVIGIIIGMSTSPGSDDASLESLLAADPGQALADTEEWASGGDNSIEAIRRWTLILNTGRLSEALKKRAERGLDRAKRSLEEEANRYLERMRTKAFELSDGDRDDEARRLVAEFPKEYRKTVAYKGWKVLKSEF